MKDKITISMDEDLLGQIHTDVRMGVAKSVSERIEMLVRMGQYQEKQANEPDTDEWGTPKS